MGGKRFLEVPFIDAFLRYCSITNLRRRILSVDTVQENVLMGVQRKAGENAYIISLVNKKDTIFQ